VRRYADTTEDDPERLAALLDRQELVRTLKRKYGATVEDVLAFRDDAARDAEAIGRSDERRAELDGEEVQVATEAGLLAGDLSAARQRVATELAERVQQELASLNMGGAIFQVRLSRRPDLAGLAVGSSTFAFDLTGVDQAEFLVAPNVGEAPKPVARICLRWRNIPDHVGLEVGPFGGGSDGDPGV